MSLATRTAIAQSATTVVPSVTASEELACFADSHSIVLQVRKRRSSKCSLSFGRLDDQRHVIVMNPDSDPAEVLDFAKTVVERSETDRKVFAIEEALAAAADGKPGFAELAVLFKHSSLWKLNGAGQFIRLIEDTLATLRQEATA
ncbi:hypothetical protein ACIQU4_15465 [Streptomyces sp. NPDC090741]|uniref:hypothetical protein n=1 Tax=Streptomyces sp. NPDC090741 TaxID=3365967 RepID=UPI0037F12DBA